MKKIIVILLVFSVLTPYLGKVVIYADFKINQDTIAEELCIYKDLPGASLCYGSCYLSEQLSKVDDLQNKQVAFELIKKQNIAFLQQLEIQRINLPKPGKEMKFPYTLNLYSFNFLKEIIAPPQFS